MAPQSSARLATIGSPRPRKLAGGGIDRAAGRLPPESVTSTRKVPSVSSTVTSKPVRACWTAFIVSSPTMTAIASRRPGGALPTACRTKRRAVLVEPGSQEKLRLVFIQ
jgi:hypothetical protein